MRLKFKFRKPSLQSWQLLRHLHTWAWISSSTLQYLLLTSTLTFTMESYCWLMVNSSMGLFPLDAYFSQQYLLQSLISLLKGVAKLLVKLSCPNYLEYKLAPTSTNWKPSFICKTIFKLSSINVGCWGLIKVTQIKITLIYCFFFSLWWRTKIGKVDYWSSQCVQDQHQSAGHIR